MNTVERRSHYRGRARAGRRVELRYRTQGDSAADGVAAVTQNIGVGGAFIISDNPPPIGTRLDVELAMPTADSPIQLKATVRWIVPEQTSRTEAGMGVKFSGVDVESLLKLSEYFASLTGDGDGTGDGTGE